VPARDLSAAELAAFDADTQAAILACGLYTIQDTAAPVAEKEQ